MHTRRPLEMHAFVPLEDPKPVLSILSQISLLGGFTDRQQSEIFTRLETGVFRRGEYVFQRGDEPSHIYIVESGAIELLIPQDGTVIEKKRLGIGDCFGQVAVMSIHQHTVSALAIEDSEVIVLSRQALHQLRHEDIELFALLMMNIARELARRLQYMDEMLLHRLHIHAPAKVLAEISGA